MNLMDFEAQRERRTELLRYAGSRHHARLYRRNRRNKARGLFRSLAGAWVVGR